MRNFQKIFRIRIKNEISSHLFIIISFKRFTSVACIQQSVQHHIHACYFQNLWVEPNDILGVYKSSPLYAFWKTKGWIYNRKMFILFSFLIKSGNFHRNLTVHIKSQVLNVNSRKLHWIFCRKKNLNVSH